MIHAAPGKETFRLRIETSIKPGRTLTTLIVCCVVSYAQTSCANIPTGLYSTGPVNIYYGVRVTLDRPYTQSVTVNGTIISGDPAVAGVDYSLTVSPGSLTQETIPSYYQTTPGTYASAIITSITPSIVTKN